MSYQEKLVGNQMYVVFALALLLVYLVLAGQYGSWYAPATVIRDRTDQRQRHCENPEAAIGAYGP